MHIAPIRSPLDMARAQARLAALAALTRGAEEELEYAALRDAVEHYRCITERVAEGSPAGRDRPGRRRTRAEPSASPRELSEPAVDGRIIEQIGSAPR